jgi:hypothetical protein
LYCVVESLQLVVEHVRFATVPSPGNEQVERLPAAHAPPHWLTTKPVQSPPCDCSGCPDVIGLQVPRFTPMSHASHLPVHGASQQYPSGEQLAVAHSLPVAHGVPFGFGPHEPPAHAFGGLHPVEVPVQLG